MLPVELMTHPLLAPGPSTATCQFHILNEEGGAGEGEEGVYLFAMVLKDELGVRQTDMGRKDIEQSSPAPNVLPQGPEQEYKERPQCYIF